MTAEDRESPPVGGSGSGGGPSSPFLEPPWLSTDELKSVIGDVLNRIVGLGQEDGSCGSPDDGKDIDEALAALDALCVPDSRPSPPCVHEWRLIDFRTSAMLGLVGRWYCVHCRTIEETS